VAISIEKPVDARGADGRTRAGLRSHEEGELAEGADWDGWLEQKALRRALWGLVNQ